MATGFEWSVIDVLVDQHRQIKQLFEQVRSGGDDKREHFDRLVRLVSAHESIEEQIVHPAARRTYAGHRVVGMRCHEENRIKHELAVLCELGVDHPEFDEKLDNLAHTVLAHTTREETEEFGALLRDMSPESLQRMAGAARVAYAVAPTRPHPVTGESAVVNVLAGPPLAVLDRTRDAVRGWFDGRRNRYPR